MTPDNATLVRTLYDFFNDRDLDQAIDFAAMDIEWLSIPFGTSFQGPEGYRSYLDSWLTAGYRLFPMPSSRSGT